MPSLDGTKTKSSRYETKTKSDLAGVYRGRIKSFPIQNDDHFLTMSRYVERNALRANLVNRADDRRWSSLYRVERGENGYHYIGASGMGDNGPMPLRQMKRQRTGNRLPAHFEFGVEQT